MFKMEFKTGNAAFYDPYTGEPSKFYSSIEVKRILLEIAEKIEAGHDSGSIMDINGNKIGTWFFE